MLDRARQNEQSFKSTSQILQQGGKKKGRIARGIVQENVKTGRNTILCRLLCVSRREEDVKRSKKTLKIDPEYHGGKKKEKHHASLTKWEENPLKGE